MASFAAAVTAAAASSTAATAAHFSACMEHMYRGIGLVRVATLAGVRMCAVTCETLSLLLLCVPLTHCDPGK